MYDIAIIGAGITGGMLARTLASCELKICILEKENDVAAGASRANSGIVHAGYDAEPGTLKALLNVRGSEMMENITQELGVPYIRNGSLVIGFSEEDREVIEMLRVRGIRNGVKGLRILDGDEARLLEPGLSEAVICALYAPTCAIICPYELTIAAIGNAMDNGAELLLHFNVAHIERKEDCYEITEAKPAEGSSNFHDDYAGTSAAPEQAVCCCRRIRARYVINAAGIHADEIARLAGDTSFRIRPRKGEYLLLDRECGGILSHTVFRTPSKMGKGILATPTVDGNLLLGPTSTDLEDKTDTATTEGGLAQIIEHARESLPDIPLNKIITSFCGLRAAGSTGDFIINSPFPGLFNAAGIESPGLTAAPAIAEYIVDMLAAQGLILRKKKDWQPLRQPIYAFRYASTEEKNQIIRRDKSYGRVVCRCETVTEGEILAAIHTNPPARDLDGIKRRTRAQMGRCQGGFCMPYIAELLSREYGIPFEQVTKSGPGSEIAPYTTHLFAAGNSMPMPGTGLG